MFRGPEGRLSDLTGHTRVPRQFGVGFTRLRGETTAGAAGHNHFNLERHINDRNRFKANRKTYLAEWRQHVAGTCETLANRDRFAFV